MKGRKTVSPIIATALLIGITVMLTAIIFVWARGFVVEQIEKYGRTAEQVCEQLSFEAEIVPTGGANLYDFYISNRGNDPIYAVDIKKIGRGKSKIDRRTILMGPGESNRSSITLERAAYDKVIIMPVLLGNVRGGTNKKPYTCPPQYGQQIVLPY